VTLVEGASANPVRGEVQLTAGSLKVVLRPSFAALVAAEQEAGSLVRIMERAAAGDIRLADIGPLFWHCARAGGDPAGDRSDFEARLGAAGIQALLPAYRELLTHVFRGG
jgi:hypothetical protein